MPQLADRIMVLRRRARLAQAVRAFFDARGFTEVETPYAVPTPGEEVHLAAFRTVQTRPDGTTRPLWLHTSPEFAMKRLLADGSGPIFQLARVWRDNEGSRRHAHEFTMLEYYAPGAGMAELMDLTEALLRAVLPPIVTSGGITTDLARCERLTVREAFARHAGVDLRATPDSVDALAAQAGMRSRDGETWEDLFFRILLGRIEPHLGRDRPTFLTHFPAAQAALARRDPADPSVAERFELFVCGIELANAFVELTDAAEQRARFVADRARRLALYPAMDWQLDEAFLTALERGLPDCAGAAMGFDRLAMIAAGADRIDQVLWLPGRAYIAAMRQLALLLLLAGCADQLAQRKAALAPFVGRDEADLVRALGVPTRSFEADGHRFLAYDETSISVLPGLPGFYPSGLYAQGALFGGYGYGGGFPPQLVERVCETTFEVNQGRVLGFALRGNACG